MVLYSAAAGLGLVTVGLCLLRRWRSSRWALCTLATRLQGQVIIVTGASTGLGLEAAKDLARRGATVVMACRNFETARPALQAVRDETGNNDVHYMHLDLASLESVRAFAEEVTAAYPAIHCLVCNAGVWVPMEHGVKTKEGYEVHAGVNHLGHFLLTSLLLDSLAEAAPSRVVVVSSGLASQGVIDFTAHDHFGTGRQPDPAVKKGGFAPIGYCDSKLMNALFVKELAVRVAGRGVTAVCLCPGWCYTDLARHLHLPTYRKLLMAPIAFLFMRSSWRGAQNIVQAVVQEPDQLVPGGFYKVLGNKLYLWHGLYLCLAGGRAGGGGGGPAGGDGGPPAAAVGRQRATHAPVNTLHIY
jgi:NAD(P)-dependent dehydrogenase (short-subunit alcohol dehydrogenase family)